MPERVIRKLTYHPLFLFCSVFQGSRCFQGKLPIGILAVDRQLVHADESRTVRDADAVLRAYPQPAPQKLHFIHAGQRRDIQIFQRFGAALQIAVIDPGILGADEDGSGGVRVGEDACDPLNGGLRMIDVIHHFPAAHGEVIPVVGSTVEQPVAARVDIIHVGVGDPGILHGMKGQIRIDHGDARRGAHIDRSVFILFNRADLGGAESVVLSPEPEFTAFHHGQAVFIGADPKPVPAVDEKAHHAAHARGGVHPLKGVPVVADESAVAADPEEAFGRLRDGIGFGGGQAVLAVVHHGGVIVASAERIRGETGGRILSGQGRLRRQQKEKGQTNRYGDTASFAAALLIGFFHLFFLLIHPARKVSFMDGGSRAQSVQPPGQADLEIIQIKEVMAANHARLDSLSDALAKANRNNANLRAQIKKLQAQLAEKEEMIANLQAQIAEKDGQIANLNTQVSNLNANLNNANNQINDLNSRNMAQDTELNTVYYIAGTKKELKEKGVMLNAKNILKSGVPTEVFTKGDKRELTTITFDAKKAVVLSNHPTGSYNLVPGNADGKKTVTLEITDPEMFWNVTKYLVVQTK